MVLKEFPPGPLTRGTIRVYRVVHFAAAAASPAVKVYPPTPEQCLQLFVQEREIVEYPDGRRVQWNAALTGAHDITVRRWVPPRFLLIQAVFEPGALRRLTGIAAPELHNDYVDAEGLWGPELRRLREQLDDMLGTPPDYRRMVARTDAFLARLVAARQASPLESLWRRLRDHPGVSLDRAAVAASLSLRQLERHCQQQTGLAPREFASLARFDRAFHTKLQKPDLDWLSIAIASGYYDYQHMARDFRGIAGMTPPQLLATQRDSPEQILGVRHEFDLSYQC